MRCSFSIDIRRAYFYTSKESTVASAAADSTVEREKSNALSGVQPVAPSSRSFGVVLQLSQNAFRGAKTTLAAWSDALQHLAEPSTVQLLGFLAYGAFRSLLGLWVLFTTFVAIHPRLPNIFWNASQRSDEAPRSPNAT